MMNEPTERVSRLWTRGKEAQILLTQEDKENTLYKNIFNIS